MKHRVIWQIGKKIDSKVQICCHPAGEWLRTETQRLGVWDGPPKPLLMGRHLAAAGMHPGRAMGELLAAAFEAQLDGRITSLKDALEWAKDHSRQQGAATPEQREG